MGEGERSLVNIYCLNDMISIVLIEQRGSRGSRN